MAFNMNRTHYKLVSIPRLALPRGLALLSTWDRPPSSKGDDSESSTVGSDA